MPVPTVLPGTVSVPLATPAQAVTSNPAIIPISKYTAIWFFFIPQTSSRGDKIIYNRIKGQDESTLRLISHTLLRKVFVLNNYISRALDLAKIRGADYTDARIVQTTEQTFAVKNGTVDALSYDESTGFGVRVLV